MDPANVGQKAEVPTLTQLVSAAAEVIDASELTDEIRRDLEAAGRSLLSRVPWNVEMPWTLGKRALSALGGCRRRAVLISTKRPWNRALAVGALADAAFKSHLFSDAGAGNRVEAALARLEAAGSHDLANWLNSIPAERLERIREEAEAAASNLTAFCPESLPTCSWVRVDEPIAVPLADGAIVLAGRPDLALWGPPTERACVLVEAKARTNSGYFQDEMRFYALLAMLRDSQLPAVAIVLCGSGEWRADPVRPDDIRAAARRVRAALETAEAMAADQAAGRMPPTMTSALCQWCDGRVGCDDGRLWLEENGLGICLDPTVDPDDVRHHSGDSNYDDDGDDTDEPF